MWKTDKYRTEFDNILRRTLWMEFPLWGEALGIEKIKMHLSADWNLNECGLRRPWGFGMKKTKFIHLINFINTILVNITIFNNRLNVLIV